MMLCLRQLVAMYLVPNAAEFDEESEGADESEESDEA